MANKGIFKMHVTLIILFPTFCSEGSSLDSTEIQSLDDDEDDELTELDYGLIHTEVIQLVSFLPQPSP